ncbi:MAG: hypothetical protein QJR08_04205 [Bacillota bacterium]|nr:hypothetical protein [Bacillota bacterium]
MANRAHDLTVAQVRILLHLSIGPSSGPMIGAVIGRGWGPALSALVMRGLVEVAMPATVPDGYREPVLYPRGWRNCTFYRITRGGHDALWNWRESRQRTARSGEAQGDG